MALSQTIAMVGCANTAQRRIQVCKAGACTWSSCSTSRWARPASAVELAMHQVEGVHLVDVPPVAITCRHPVDVPPVVIAGRPAWWSWPRTRSRASTWSSCCPW